MASQTVENYLKAVLLLEMKSTHRTVSTGEIASALSVSPSTVTCMLKSLSHSNLVRYRPYDGVKLTASGRRLATSVLRRHRLLELFLTQTLEMKWDEVHMEAEQMEHSVSDRLVDRIEAYLDNPRFDPHGDPIPKSDGTIAPREERTLLDCRPQEELKIVCVKHQDPAFLRYLSDTGLELNAKATVLENRPEAGIMELKVGERSVTIARESADKILVASSDGS